MFKLLNKEKINSIALAILICANPLSWIAAFSGGIVVIIGISFMIAILNNNIYFLFNKVLFLIIAVVSIFLITIALSSGNLYLKEYLLAFLVFGIPALLMSQLNFETTFLYKAIGIIGLLLIPFIRNIHFGDLEYETIDYGMWMGISYGILRLIISLILCIVLIKKRVYRILSFILVLFYISFLMTYGSRGAVLAVAFFIIVYLFILTKKPIKFVGYVSVGLIILYVLVGLFFNHFLEELYFFNKFERMESTGDVSNGRTMLYTDAWNGFFNSPIFGNGFASFEGEYGRYPHNFFLQMLYEGGTIWGGFFLFLILLLIYYIINNKLKNNEKVFILFLFSTGIIELVFSSVYWKSQIFWLFIGYLIGKKYLKNESISTSI